MDLDKWTSQGALICAAADAAAPRRYGWDVSRLLKPLSRKLARVLQATASLSRTATDAVLPPLCPISGARVAEAGMLSPEGWTQVHFIADPVCAQCGAPFALDYGAGAICPACVADPPRYDAARAAVVYDDVTAPLFNAFKHGDRTELAPMFAIWVARAGSGFCSSGALLAPVPLHRRRLIARRYNQAALLAHGVAQRLNAPLNPALLVRRRATKPQQSLSPERRRRNVAGAFTVHPDARAAVRGAHIVLVDDVLTTGATLSACASALKRAGAPRVDALVAARVVSAPANAI